MPKLAEGSDDAIGRRGHLGRLDEPHARRAVVGREKPQEALAVAVLAADDLLLPPLPVVQADELIEDELHGQHQRRRRPSPPRAATAR